MGGPLWVDQNKTLGHDWGKDFNPNGGLEDRAVANEGNSGGITTAPWMFSTRPTDANLKSPPWDANTRIPLDANNPSYKAIMQSFPDTLHDAFNTMIAVDNAVSDFAAYGGPEAVFGIASGALKGFVGFSRLFEAAETVGSGPASGFLEVSDAYASSKAVQNFGSPTAIDFIFDSQSGRFIMGDGGILGHDGILAAGKITPSETTVGGTIWRENGSLMTDEWSGHYGQNWTPEIRQQFPNFTQQHGVNITHTVGAIMNRELQSRLLTELARPGLSWETGQNHDSQGQATVQWLPIAHLTQARIQLGVSSDASWVRATAQSLAVFGPDKACVFLLPVLEVGLDEARRLLERGLQASGLSTEFLKAFPFEDIVVTGLESHSEHWASLALRWAEQLPTSSKLQSALQTLKVNGPTQKVRHAAQKFLARQGGADDQK